MTYSQFTRHFEKKQQIFGQHWSTKDAKGIVILVHGLGEHSSRYQHVADMLNAGGYSMIGFDLPGHGRSSGKRGHISSFKSVAKIITYFIDYAKKQYPGLPVFIYGHSMGGCMVLNYAATENPKLTGIIASAPSLKTGRPTPPATYLIGKILSTVYPSFQLHNGLIPRELSLDPNVVQAYIKDPMVHNKVSTALGIEVLQKGKWLLSKKQSFPAPLFVFQGSGDMVIDTQAVREFVNQTESPVTIQEWEGLLHETHNESEKDLVIRTMIEWMNNTLN